MLERLKAGGEENDRGWGGWMASPTWWIWVWVSSGNWWWTGKPGYATAHGIKKNQTWLSEWTKLNWYITECHGLNCLLYHHVINSSLTVMKASWRIHTSQVAQMVKNPSAVQKTQLWSVGWEDSLEKGMTTHSSIPAWRIPWTESRLQSTRSQRLRHNWATNKLLYLQWGKKKYRKYLFTVYF